MLRAIFYSVAFKSFQEQLQARELQQRALADVVQLFPEPVEIGSLLIVEHQPSEMIILPIEEPQREDLVDRHDLVEAERSREQATILIESPLDPPPRRAVFGGEKDSLERNVSMIREHLGHFRERHGGLAGNQPGRSGRRADDHVNLHTPLAARLLVERSGRDQLAAGCQVAGKTNLDDRGDRNKQRGRADRMALGVFAEQGRVQAPLRCPRRFIRGLNATRIPVEPSDIAEVNIRAAGRDQPGGLPHNEVILVAVPRVGRHKREYDFFFIAEIIRYGETDLLFAQQRIDRFHPPRWASLPADQADRAERPQPPLPGGDGGGERNGICWFRLAPSGTEIVQKQRWSGPRKSGPKRAEILGAQPVLTGHDFERLTTGRQCIPFGERGGEIFLQRQAPGESHAGVTVDFDVPDRRTDPEILGVGELAIEPPNPRQAFIRPVAPRRLRGETKAGRQQHRVSSDPLSRVEIFPQQGRRHHQRVARIGEPFPRGAIARELAGRI